MTARRSLEAFGRRCISVPLYFFLAISVTLTLPATSLFAVCCDLVRRTRWSFCRSLGFLLVYLYCECAGMLLALGMWIFSGKFLGLNKAKFIEWMYWLQYWWGRSLCRGAFRMFGLRMTVEGYDQIKRGPLVVMCRHESLMDTAMPGLLFIVGRKMRIRHIMKHELLWDPCLDIGGSLLPHIFVRRGAPDNKEEILGIQRLMDDLGENDGVMIFPEGTRFTQEKRERIIDRLARKGDEYFLEKARRLKNVLPPRLGGSLALLERNINACVVFCAHVGFKATTKMWDVLNGSLVNRTILVKLWKVPFEQIPKTREEQIEWLYDHWRMIDEWIEEHSNLSGLLPQPNFRP